MSIHYALPRVYPKRKHHTVAAGSLSSTSSTPELSDFDSKLSRTGLYTSYCEDNFFDPQ
jgi:hypothetical protein